MRTHASISYGVGGVTLTLKGWMLGSVVCLLAGQGSIIGALFFNGSALCSVHAEHLFFSQFQ